MKIDGGKQVIRYSALAIFRAFEMRTMMVDRLKTGIGSRAHLIDIDYVKACAINETE